MTDYTFYTDTYLGNAIPQKAFPEFALRAKEELERLQRSFRVSIPGEDSMRMAICALAETLYAHSKRRGGVTAATVGEVSVRYEGGGQGVRDMHRELYRKAGIYLDISRGVSA